ncbi:hypothetical protein BP5796_09668 [Coleophoma crateriformis]|uniref:FAD dependent oxidoreductase domain-containing protein n=1 Tax=Coleophoma crateriformis TaxID=565419 RepID=A0A3D8QYQ6_9HELO|nr:hypothetical protein BP5796_09668 [Coleophoma crateriformis]
MVDNTVILGAGIIGVATAYYLSSSQNPKSIHLVEPSPKLFASASGNAGGFLAADWFTSSVAELGRLSFDEHRRIAEEFNGREKWGYSRSTSISLSPGRESQRATRADDWLRQGESREFAASARDNEQVGGDGWEPDWLRNGEGDTMEMISEEDNTAQVWVRTIIAPSSSTTLMALTLRTTSDPFRLSQFLLERCLERGVQLHHPAKAISIGKDVRDELASICILDTTTNTETDIPCFKLLIAAGVWSPRVFSDLFTTSEFCVPAQSLAGHSLVVKSPRWTSTMEGKSCHAIFTRDPQGYSPEVFSRLGGEIYIAGLNSDAIPVPELATASTINENAIIALLATSRRLLGRSHDDAEIEILRKGLCFRPVTKKGTPILSKIADQSLGGVNTRPDGEGGVFLAAGHGPWGITLGLGTGKVMAGIIQGKTVSADVSRLSF